MLQDDYYYDYDYEEPPKTSNFDERDSPLDKSGKSEYFVEDGSYTLYHN